MTCLHDEALVKSLLKIHMPAGHVISDLTYVGQGRLWQVYQARLGGHWKLAVRFRLADGRSAKELSTSVYQFVPGMPHRITYACDKDYCLDVYPWVPGETTESPVDHKVSIPPLAATLFHLHAAYPIRSPNRFAGQWWIDEVLAELLDALDYLRVTRLYEQPGALFVKLSSELDRLSPNRTSVLHGDLSPRNVLLDEEPNQYHHVNLIDWDDIRYGDYMWDLANWGTFHEDDLEGIELMLKLYHGLDKDGKSIHPLLWRRFWVYFLCVSLGKASHLHRLGYTDLTRALARVRFGLDKLTSYA